MFLRLYNRDESKKKVKGIRWAPAVVGEGGTIIQ